MVTPSPGPAPGRLGLKVPEKARRLPPSKQQKMQLARLWNMGLKKWNAL
jgi:hypothetical protein